MKLQTIVSAVLFATVSALSAAGAYAEDTTTGKADKAPAMGMTHDDMTQHHSQMHEQTEAAPKAKAPAGGDKAKAKANAAKDKHKHFHPRDGK